MRKIIFSIIFIASIVFSASAQKINQVPPVPTYNLPNGWHKFIDQGATFDVEVLESKLTQGNIIWLDQSKYSGSLFGHTITGKGTYTWPDKKRYEGGFKKNNRHGWGVMYYLDGTKYSGKWKNNKKQGKGKFYDKDGKVVQQGVWENDIYVGAKKKKKKKKS